MGSPNLTVRVEEEEKAVVESVAKELYHGGTPSQLVKAFIGTLKTKPLHEIREFVSPPLRSKTTLKPLAFGSGNSNMVLTCSHGAPCGQWAPADQNTTAFEISGHIAALWGIQPGDEVLQTHGCSMLEKGIPEHAFLHMRPLCVGSPKPGSICAIVALMDDGTALGTVKTWEWPGRSVVLTDGQRRKVELPRNAVRIEARAVWTGHLIS